MLLREIQHYRPELGPLSDWSRTCGPAIPVLESQSRKSLLEVNLLCPRFNRITEEGRTFAVRTIKD